MIVRTGQRVGGRRALRGIVGAAILATGMLIVLPQAAWALVDHRIGVSSAPLSQVETVPTDGAEDRAAEPSAGLFDVAAPGGVGRLKLRLAAMGARRADGPNGPGHSAQTPETVLWRPLEIGRREGALAEDGGGGRARLLQIAFESPSLSVGGRMAEAGRHLSPLADLGGESAGEDGMPAVAAGERAAQFSAEWTPSPGLCLTSRRESSSKSGVLDPERGLTTVETAHALVMNLGPGSELRAGAQDEVKQWDPSVGATAQEKRTRTIELATSFGRAEGDGVRLGLTSVLEAEGEQERSRRTQEAHFQLTPRDGLRLTADHVAKANGDGQERTKSTVGAVMRLAAGAELSATMVRQDHGGGQEARDAGFALKSGLGSGSSSGQVTVEQHSIVRETGADAQRRVLGFAGKLAGAEVSLRTDETVEEGSAGGLSGQRSLEVRRELVPGVTLAAQHREKLAGTHEVPQITTHSGADVTAELGGTFTVSAALATDEAPGGFQSQEHHLALSREWQGLRVRAERRAFSGGETERANWGCVIERPSGELPEWAAEIPVGHAFEDADEYLLAPERKWVREGIGFAGSRLCLEQRDGGDEDGRDTLAFEHRMVVGDRYALRLVYEDRPEGLEGSDKGRPLGLSRRFLEVGTRVRDGLVTRVRLGEEVSLLDDEGGVREVGLGLWGTLGADEKVEGEVVHRSGRWEDASVDWTSVSLLYSLRVSEEHQVYLKAGYGWGDGGPWDGGSRECRMTAGYSKPI